MNQFDLLQRIHLLVGKKVKNFIMNTSSFLHPMVDEMIYNDQNTQDLCARPFVSSPFPEKTDWWQQPESAEMERPAPRVDPLRASQSTKRA